MKKRCPDSLAVGIAFLPCYRLTFPRFYEGWEWGGVASVEPCVSEEKKDACGVWGVIYRISEKDLERLDRYEHIEEGHYTRGIVSVEIEGEAVMEAVTYFAIPNTETPVPPSKLYMETIIRGAEAHGLPMRYIEKLKGIATNTGANEET